MNEQKRQQAILSALAAAQASIDLALALMLGEEEPVAANGCQHRRKQNISGMGGPEKWICADCRQEVSP